MYVESHLFTAAYHVTELWFSLHMYWLGVIFIYYRALDIRTKAYGPDHLDVGQTLLTYSAFLLSVDASKSADAAIKAVEIFEV